MSTANTVQVGGDHYRKAGNTLQHWDWAAECRLGYFESAATKYLSRWREKHGDPAKQLEDLRKAAHYLQKLCELAQAGKACPVQTHRPRGVGGDGTLFALWVSTVTSRFLGDNLKDAPGRPGYGTERRIVNDVTRWAVHGDMSALREAREAAEKLLLLATKSHASGADGSEAGAGYTNQDR